MIPRSFIFFFFILIKPFTLKAEGVCNETLNCGNNISKKTCVDRGCCYLPSPSRKFECVRRSKSPTTQEPNYDFRPEIPPDEEAEYYPPDAIQLPSQLSSNLKRLLVTGQNQVTPMRAIRFTNLLIDFLKLKAFYESDKNWEMSEKGIFFAKIIVERSTFKDTFHLESNTHVHLHPFRKETWSEVEVLIIVEYFTPIDIWTGTKQKSEIKKDNCPNSKPVTNNSTVVSVNIFKEYDIELLNMFEVVLNVQRKEGFSAPESLTCEMLNETTEDWTRSGCELTEVSKEFAVCLCNHTANKYVLMDLKAQPLSKTPVKLTHVEIVEFVMEGLSFGSLSITLITLIFLHQRRAKSYSSGFARAKEKMVVHTNFVAALTGLHLTKLISEVVYTENFACEITVVFSHYFMLASGMWMLIESLMLYFTIIVKSLKQASTGYLKLILGWGIPAAIVVISAAIGISNGSYIKRKHQEMMCAGDDVTVEQPFMSTASDCSINFEGGVIWSVIGPLLAIFIINLFVLSHTVGFVIWLNVQTKSKSPAVQHIWNATKGILVLVPILGIPWLIGFFRSMSTNYVSLALQYVYVILNGLQGFFIFILYCGCNKEAHKAFKKVTNGKTRRSIKFSQSRSGNNSTMSFKDRIRKSSLIGYNANIKQHRPYANIYWRFDGQTNQKPLQNNLQRPRSASFSSGTTRFRIRRRNRSVTLIDKSDLGLKRAWSTKSLYGGNNRPSVIPGLNLEPGQPAMIAFNFEEVASSEPVSVLPSVRRPRSTVKEFSRFSVIPEELKRASVLETLVLETNDSDEVFHKNDKILKDRTEYRNEQQVIVDVHKFPSEKIKTRRLMVKK